LILQELHLNHVTLIKRNGNRITKRCTGKLGHAAYFPVSLVVIEDLVPLATVVTPNIHEAEAMLNSEIKTLEDMKRAVSRIREMFFSLL